VRTRLRALTACLVLGVGGLAGTPAMAAQPAAVDTLGVDFAARTGPFRGGASGTLYGFGDHGAPTQALINGAHITNSSQKAPYGTQHPSGDALQIEDGFFAKYGQELAVYVQDYYPDWAYHGGVRPGDDRTYDLANGTYTNIPNGIWDYLEIVEFVTEAVATQSEHPEKYLLIPFNEPDAGNWYGNWATMKDTFLADWKATYDKIQEVYARHGLAPARIGGPGDAVWRPERSRDILGFAKSTDTLPDVFIWHELGIDNLATFRSHLADYRALERQLGVGPIHVNITEYGMLRDMGAPGQLIQWFSMFEDAKVDAQTAYWNYAGNLSDNSARAGGANGGWWLFKWYGDLAGSETVRVTPPALNAVDTLQGIGAIDTRNKRATVLYGGTGNDVRLDLRGLGAFGSKVDVEVREVTLTGAQGVTTTPRVVKALDGVRLTNGRVTLDVPTYDRYAAYQVIVTPEQSRPVATSPVWTASVEAEETAITGAQVYVHDPKGNGGWDFMVSHSSDVGSFKQVDSRADWTVSVPRNGKYRFQVIGGTSGPPGRHALFVDGNHAATIQYTAGRGWAYRGSAELTVDLTKGSHVLSVRTSADGVSVLPNADVTLDKFVLTDVTSGEPTTYPASTLRYSGGARLTWDAGTKGYGQVAGSGRVDGYVTAMESGYHDLVVRYRTDCASDLRLTVNGRVVATFKSPRAGEWTSTVRTHLPEGISEVELTSAREAKIASVTTVRVPQADSAAHVIEAEQALLTGTAVVVTDPATSPTNASGGAHVEWIGQGAGNSVEVPRVAGIDRPGDYNVVVRYANAELGSEHPYNPQVVDRRLDVGEAGVDGVAGSAYFRYTHTWDSYWDHTVQVRLSTRGGALRLYNADGWAPNIDRIAVAPVVVGTPTTVATK